MKARSDRCYLQYKRVFFCELTIFLILLLDSLSGKDDIETSEDGDGAIFVVVEDRLRFILELAHSIPYSKALLRIIQTNNSTGFDYATSPSADPFKNLVYKPWKSKEKIWNALRIICPGLQSFLYQKESSTSLRAFEASLLFWNTCELII